MKYTAIVMYDIYILGQCKHFLGKAGSGMERLSETSIRMCQLPPALLTHLNLDVRM